MKNDSSQEIYTMNDFILYHEKVLSQKGLKFIIPKQVGDIHEKDYCAFKFQNPEIDFPSSIDAAIISVSGFTLNENKISLKVCWDTLEKTLHTVFLKIKKEIVIICAGRKLFEAQGHEFINLLSLPEYFQNRSSKIKLTIVVDMIIKENKKNLFANSIKLMNRHFGDGISEAGIIYWTTQI